MSYHIRIEYNRNDGELRLNLSEEDLVTQYVTPFLNGDNLMINGRQIHQHGIARIKIVDGPIEQAIDKIKYQDKLDPPLKTFLSPSVEWRAMDLLIDVTNKFITRPPTKKEKIEIKEEVAKPVQPDSYIAIDRIEELKGINNKSWDLTKLIRLCEEINDNWHTKTIFL